MTQSPEVALETIAQTLVDAARQGAAAYTQAVADIWPEEGGAMVRHEPALPHDGPVTKEQLIAGHRFQDETMAKAMPDYRLEKVAAKVAGDRILMTYTQAGTLADGGKIAATIGVRLTMAGGLVRESVLEINPDEIAPMLKLFGMTDGAPAH